MSTLIELCAGTASLSLWALARLPPLVGYMGSKRRLAPLLVDMLGCDRPDCVVLVDAGPWGDVWATLSSARERRRVREALQRYQHIERPKLWADLTSRPPADDPAERVAQYLWLQARAAGTIPVWWSAENGRWESPTGSRTEAAHQRGGTDLRRRQKAPGRAYQTGDGNGDKVWRGCRGIQNPATIADRIEALDRLPWDRIDVLPLDCRLVEPRSSAIVYIDPPYLGCPRYAELLPRADVLELAKRWSAAGAPVAISEAEPLPLVDWQAIALPAHKPEYVTANWPIRPLPQLDLFGRRDGAPAAAESA